MGVGVKVAKWSSLHRSRDDVAVDPFRKSHESSEDRNLMYLMNISPSISHAGVAKDKICG